MAGRPIVIDLVGNDSQLKKTLKNASGSLKDFGKKVGKIGITAGAAFGATAVAIGTKGVTAFADWEKSLSEVMTLLPEAGEETFKELGDQAKDFSKTFGVSTSDALDGLYSSLSAGIPKDNVFEFMETAQKAAAAGVTSLETAVDGISSVVNSYGAEVITAGEASDLMFTAVKLGKTTFEEISASISLMAPIASAVGVPFDALTGSIAHLTAAGTPTQVAAGQMRAAMAELAKEGTKADVAFRDLAGVGLQQFLDEGGTFDEAVIMMKEGADASGQSVLDLFSSIEAGSAVLALTSDGGEKFKATLDEMAASGGSTEAAFSTMDSTLGASFAKIKANIEVLIIEIGEKLAPLVAKATDFMVENFDKLKPLLNDIKDAVIDFGKRAIDIIKSVSKWIKDNEGWLTMLAATVGAVVLAVKTYNGVVKAQKAITTAMTTATKVAAGAQTLLNAAMAMNPIGLVVAAVVALIAILAAAYWKFDSVRKIVDKVFDVFKDMADMFMDYAWPLIEKVIGLIVKQFKYFWDQIKLAVDLVMSLFKGDFAGAWDALKEMVSNAIGMIIDTFIDLPMDIIRAVAPLAGKLALIVADFYVHLVEKVFGLYKKIIGFFIDLPMDLIRALAPLPGKFALIVADFSVYLVQKIFNFYKEIIGFFISLPVDLVKALAPLVGKFALIVADFSTHLVEKVLNLIKGLPGKILDLLTKAAQSVISIGKDMGGWIISGLGNALEAVGEKIRYWFHSAINTVYQAIVGFGKDIGGWIINGLVNAITGGASAIWDAIKGALPSLDDIGGFFGSAAGAIGSLFKADKTGLGEATRTTFATVEDQFAALPPLKGGTGLGAYTVVPTTGFGQMTIALDELNKGFASGALSHPSHTISIPWDPDSPFGAPSQEAIDAAIDMAILRHDLNDLNGNGNGTEITINVNAGLGTDGNQVGDQIVSALTSWERTNGSIPISVQAL